MAMNSGFAAYLAKKKAGGVKPESKKMTTSMKAVKGSSMDKVAKRQSKVMTAPKNMKPGKYL